MRSMWKGAISFGLVSIQVRLYPATEDHGVRLHQVHVEDGGRIRMRRVCEKDGQEVGYGEIAKGYQDAEGRTAILTDADMAELPLPSRKLIDVLAFVDTSAIDPLRLSRAYYVGADGAPAAKPYVLLREALVNSGRVAVTKITLRTRESLALLRVHDDVLVLHTMHWPDELRDSAGLAPSEKVTVRPQELTMAGSLMDTLSEGFDLDSLHDEYQQALDTLVAARLQGAEPPPTEEAGPPPDNVVDLMSALQASIDARSEESGAPAERKTPEKSSGGGGGARSDEQAGTAGRGRKRTAEKKTAGSKKTTSGGKKAKRESPKKSGGRKAG